VIIGCSNLINQKVGNPKAFICCRIEEYGSQAESSALIQFKDKTNSIGGVAGYM